MKYKDLKRTDTDNFPPRGRGLFIADPSNFLVHLPDR